MIQFLKDPFTSFFNELLVVLIPDSKFTQIINQMRFHCQGQILII